MPHQTARSQHWPERPAYLGEVVVHAQDIRQPLGLVRTPSVDALTPVAGFFARRDFTVASRADPAVTSPSHRSLNRRCPQDSQWTMDERDTAVYALRPDEPD